MLRKNLFYLLAICFLFACSDEKSSNSEPHAENKQASNIQYSMKDAEDSHAQESGNVPISGHGDATLRAWDTIKKSGFVRLARLKWEDNTSLPRSGTTSQLHFNLIKQFAENNDLETHWLLYDSLPQMFEALANNEVDLIPRHLTITAEREEHFEFTAPILLDKEKLIGSQNSATVLEEAELVQANIPVSLPRGSAYIESVKRQFPSWQVEELDSSFNSEEIADLIAAGKIQYSVLDGLAVNNLQSYRNDFSVLKTLPESRYYSWALAKDNHQLKANLNDFITKHQINLTKPSDHQFDLDAIKAKGLALRVITRNSPETYFLWKGELMGFEYELMKAFAKQHKLRLEVVVAENYPQMIEMLNQGKGDLIAAGVSRTEERKKDLTFSFRYNRVSEQIVANKSSVPLKQLSDLKGREIHVRKSSAFWKTANQLANDYGAKVIAADESTSTEMLIGLVADKQIDLTIADSNLIGIELSFRDNIETPLTLNEDIPYAYVVRPENPKLLSALNQFIRKEYRNTFYNVVKNKYFASESRKQKYKSNRIISGSSLSPYDALVKPKAKALQFDWRLIISQMYQESRFNPEAKSAAGAIGLMQVLPRTANEMGYQNLLDPEQAISAGVEYLDWTRQRFSEAMPLQERVLFALAAYNVGYGHVRDAQRLAKQLGLKSDRWFNHVEKAMLLLQQPKYYKKARFGYCRGSEPVNYVRDIQQRYLTYVEVL